MGHLVTQFQGQILRDAANNRVRGHASVCGYAPLPLLVTGGGKKIPNDFSPSHYIVRWVRVRVNFVAMVRVSKLLESNINPSPNSISALTLIMTLNSH